MIERPDAVEIGAALCGVGLLLLVLAPIIARAEAAIAVMTLIERGFR